MFGTFTSSTASDGLPIVRCTDGGNGAGSPVATLNDHTLFAGSVSLPGPLSSVSTSWTLSLKIVTVHVSPAAKLTFGVMTHVAPSVVWVLVASSWDPVEAQVTSNQLASTNTGSEKVMVTLASCGAMVLPLAGSTVTTNGPISWIGAVRRGFGAPATKSAPLTSVSVAPLFLRKSAVVLLAAGALVLPSRQFAVVP